MSAPRALIVGGLDPSAGAGIVLDAFIAARCGMQPAAVASTLTAQNSAHFTASTPTVSGLLADSMRAVYDEGPFACVKLGALGSVENVVEIARLLASAQHGPVVLDPVIASSSGGELSAPDVLAALVSELLPMVDLVTPNGAEVVAMAAATADSSPSEAAAELAERTGCAVLVTGLRPAEDTRAIDLLVSRDGESLRLPHEYLADVGDVRGTGCMFSTAIACRLGHGLATRSAIEAAQRDVLELLRLATHVGRGRTQIDLARLVRGS